MRLVTDRPAPRLFRLGALLACIATASMLVPDTARADIVWEGKLVSAWPDQDEHVHTYGDDDEGDPELMQQVPRGFFPAPKGTIFGLTILVDFSDQAPAFNKTQIDAWLNQKGYTVGGMSGSVRDYFADVSNGQVDLQNDLVGFYRATRPKSYYEGGTGYQRADQLFTEVINALDATVDFSKYDNDRDGRTDAISIVYAGNGVKWGQGLWPHASGSGVRKDGVVISRYMMSALSSRLGLYVFAHETGHMLFGWPDLYGFGDYCVMGNGANPLTPPGVNDFFRADQGWIPRVDLNRSSNASYTATPNGAGYAYANPLDAGEVYFWSNVQNTGRWRALRGSGLLMFHYVRKNRVNNPPNPLVLSVVQADGLKQLDLTQWPSPGSDARDFFFGGGNAAFSDLTTPSARWANGTASGLRIQNIGPNGSAIRFDVGTGAAATLR